MYTSRASTDRLGREACLEALLVDTRELEAGRLVVELDESVMKADRRLMAKRLRSDLPYLHAPAVSEPLLWVSDAVAWCWQRGGDWKRRAQPLVAHVHACD